MTNATTPRKVCLALCALSVIAASVNAIAIVQTANAESGRVYIVPGLNALGLPSGYTMTVDATWVRGYGYRPIGITITDRTGAVLADTQFDIAIEIRGIQRQQTAASGKLVIPEGKTTASTIISVPQIYDIQMGSVRVRQNGIEVLDLRVDFHRHIRGMAGDTFSVLFIDRDAPTPLQRWTWRNRWNTPQAPVATTGALPDPRAFTNNMPVDASFPTMPDDAALLRHFDTTESICLRRPVDLPGRWIDLTCFDMTIISWNDARAMKQAHPKQWEAVRNWAMAGGTLCVYDAGDGFQQLDSFEEHFDLPLLSHEKKYRGWDEPHPIYQAPATSQISVDTFESESDGGEIVDDAIDFPTPDFVFRRFQMGMLVAIGSDDPFPGSDVEWGWILNTIGRGRWNWPQRHGMSPGFAYGDFDEYLIPGVGKPPINLFRVLITVFVLVIGPLNYHLLRRARRLYLVLITVPAGALVVTLSLIGYAVVSDGLGVRARVLSYTLLDQANERGTSWSRQTYYAGLAPRNGLSFSDDTAVYKYARADNWNRDNYGILWDNGIQRLATGYIQSRIMTQLLVIRQHQSRAQLVVDESKNDASKQKPPTVENLLRSKIEYLLLVDSNSNLYGGKDIEVGAKQKLTALSKDNEINYGFRIRLEKSTLELLRIHNIHSSVNSLLLKELRAKHLTPGSRLKPRTYVAIVENSPEVPLGVKSVTQEGSFHLIEGHW